MGRRSLRLPDRRRPSPSELSSLASLTSSPPLPAQQQEKSQETTGIRAFLIDNGFGEFFHSIVDDHGIGTMEDLCDDHLLSDHDLTTDVGMDAEQIEAFRAAISVVQEN